MIQKGIGTEKEGNTVIRRERARVKERENKEREGGTFMKRENWIQKYTQTHSVCIWVGGGGGMYARLTYKVGRVRLSLSECERKERDVDGWTHKIYIGTWSCWPHYQGWNH